MKIIQGTLYEIEQIADLFNQYRMFYDQQSDLVGVRAYLSARIQNKESVVFLAIDQAVQNRALGFTQLYPLFSSVSMQKLWLLNDLYVAPEARKKGVARALIAQAKQLAKETGAKGLLLETTMDNKNAQKLYNETGFKVDETIHYHFHLPKE